MNAWRTVLHHWSSLQGRERQAVTLMVAVLLACAAWLLLVQPSREHLAQAREHQHTQRLLAAQAQRAQPWQAVAPSIGTPQPSLLNDTALAAGLQVSRFDVDSDTLRMTVSGEAGALLGWLRQVEQQGVRPDSVVLELGAGVLQLSLSSRL